jgi:hypothetical protein
MISRGKGIRRALLPDYTAVDGFWMNLKIEVVPIFSWKFYITAIAWLPYLVEATFSDCEPGLEEKP